MVLGSLLVGAGVLLVTHAGYSAYHYKALVEARYGSLAAPIPLDVWAELLLSFLLVVFGSLLTVGTFQPIYSSSEATLKFVDNRGRQGTERCPDDRGAYQRMMKSAPYSLWRPLFLLDRLHSLLPAAHFTSSGHPVLISMRFPWLQNAFKPRRRLPVPVGLRTIA